MVEGGFQEEAEARNKYNRARLSSTQLSTYFVGSMALWELERDVRRRLAGPRATRPEAEPSSSATSRADSARRRASTSAAISRRSWPTGPSPRRSCAGWSSTTCRGPDRHRVKEPIHPVAGRGGRPDQGLQPSRARCSGCFRDRCRATAARPRARNSRCPPRRGRRRPARTVESANQARTWAWLRPSRAGSTVARARTIPIDRPRSTSGTPAWASTSPMTPSRRSPSMSVPRKAAPIVATVRAGPGPTPRAATLPPARPFERHARVPRSTSARASARLGTGRPASCRPRRDHGAPASSTTSRRSTYTRQPYAGKVARKPSRSISTVERSSSRPVIASRSASQRSGSDGQAQALDQ